MDTKYSFPLACRSCGLTIPPCSTGRSFATRGREDTFVLTATLLLCKNKNVPHRITATAISPNTQKCLSFEGCTVTSEPTNAWQDGQNPYWIGASELQLGHAMPRILKCFFLIAVLCLLAPGYERLIGQQ